MPNLPNDPNPSDSEQDPDDDYSWNGGRSPNFGSYDGPSYRQRAAEPNIDALSEAFNDFCSAKGAFEPTTKQLQGGVLGLGWSTFTSIFSSSFIAKEEHSSYGIKESLDFGGEVGHRSRIDVENGKLYVLAYSLKSESRAFFLPTVIAQPREIPLAPWGSITMELVESLNPFCDSVGAAGMIAEVSINGDFSKPNTNSLQPFIIGPSRELSLQHVADLAEGISGDKIQRQTPWVSHLPASIVVAFALTEISRREPTLLGLTGVDLSDDEKLLTIGAVVADLDKEPLNSFSLTSGPKEKAYRFSLDMSHPALVFPHFLDTNGTLFGMKI